MNLTDCRTTAERDVLVTYRRMMRRKGAHWFGTVGAAVREEMRYGAILSPEFVKDFTRGTREVDEFGNLTLSKHGRRVLEDIAGVSVTETTGS